MMMVTLMTMIMNMIMMMMMTMKTMEIVIKAYVYFPSDSCTNGLCRSQTRGVISLEGASSHIKYNCLLNKYNIHFFCGMFLCVGKAKQLSRFISSNKCIISASSHIKYNCLSTKYTFVRWKAIEPIYKLPKISDSVCCRIPVDLFGTLKLVWKLDFTVAGIQIELLGKSLVFYTGQKFQYFFISRKSLALPSLRNCSLIVGSHIKIHVSIRIASLIFILYLINFLCLSVDNLSEPCFYQFFVFCLPISYVIMTISVCVVYISILWTRARCGIIKSGPAPLRWHFLSASLTSEALLYIVTAPCIITMDPNPTLAPRFKFISFDLRNPAPLKWHFLSASLTSEALQK